MISALIAYGLVGAVIGLLAVFISGTGRVSEFLAVAALWPLALLFCVLIGILTLGRWFDEWADTL